MQPAQVRSDSSDTYWKISGGPPADGLGAVVDTYAVRAAAEIDDVQDGGAVSALLIGLLAAGEIDGALVSKPSADPDEQWKGVATIATTADEIRAASGSFYNQTMALAELDLSRVRAAAEAAHRRGRDAVRGAGAAGHAGAALAHGRSPGRCGRPDDRADVHEELRLRGADAAGSSETSAASIWTGCRRWT